MKSITRLLLLAAVSIAIAGCDSAPQGNTAAPKAAITSTQEATSPVRAASEQMPFDFVQFNRECNIVIAGQGPSAPTVYSGSEHMGGCMAVVPVEQLSQRYSHCALSLMTFDPEMEGRLRSCDFDINDADSIYFRNYPTKQFCRFICVKNGSAAGG
ncbi:MAG: hypothetical protein K0M64_06425 [Rhizobium sp.]|nr:hypothetical protein [Rhizobium sp.]